jgi:hypothetical protein
MKRIIIVLFITSFIINSSIAQVYEIDGLRLSENFYGSTARNLGLAGATGSIGGDLGSISANPAGIGVFRTSELSISPTYSSLNTNSTYLNKSYSDFKPNPSLGNLGAVFTFNTGNSSNWISFNLALGYNRVNDFSNRNSFSGVTNNTTLGNEFSYYANGKSLDELDDYRERLAYDSYILNKSTGNSYYTPYDSAQAVNPDGSYIRQDHTYTREGYSGDYYIGIGANYDNKFYFGATLNIRSTYYSDEVSHTESQQSNFSFLDKYTYEHTLKTWGKGFGVKIGAIYRPIELVRLGISIHTPTFTNISQEFSTRMKSKTTFGTFDYVPVDNNSESLAPYQDNFAATTPFRAIFSGSFMFWKYGFISADYEIADYRGISFSDGDNQDNIAAANKNINNAFGVTNNFRVGAEAKLNQFYLRGGFAYYQNPINTKTVNSLSIYNSADTYIYSGGIGFRTNSFFIDFAYSLLSKEENYYMYNDPNLKPADLKSTNGSFMATLGFKF